MIGQKSSNLACVKSCLLYTSDAADERSSVDLGGRRIIKKKINIKEDKNYHREEKKHRIRIKSKNVEISASY